MRNCELCGQAFELVAKAHRRRFCSSVCLRISSYGREREARRKPVTSKLCVYCGTEFESAGTKQSFCSADCRNLNNRERASNRWRELNPQPTMYEFVCDRCGSAIVRDSYLSPGRYGRFCESCRLERKAARYRKKTVRRQGVAKPATIYFDDVLARDGAVCWLCNDAIDLSLLRTSRMGATLDHVIPISKGGADSLDNLRLAHWICNNKKSNKIVEAV
jgi:5-methylcytosine-specific restriction endonuclease McrA